uniref:Hint domain-containing protein n=1 Tax=Gouania willdenowi TaxID=441366 RepID=A0A8C5DNC3_GOUWI
NQLNGSLTLVSTRCVGAEIHLKVSGIRPSRTGVRIRFKLVYLFIVYLFPSTDHSVAAKSGGCFPGGASVMVEGGGRKRIVALRPRERVLAWSDGEPVFSEVMAFLDRNPQTLRLFHTLHTDSGARLSLTAAHLVFVAERNCSEGRVSVEPSRGVFAPLTWQGTLVVDGVLSSCYAVLDQHSLAHRAFAPLRLLHRWVGAVGGGHGNGVGSKLLDSGLKILLSEGFFFSMNVWKVIFRHLFLHK